MAIKSVIVLAPGFEPETCWQFHTEGKYSTIHAVAAALINNKNIKLEKIKIYGFKHQFKRSFNMRRASSRTQYNKTFFSVTRVLTK